MAAIGRILKLGLVPVITLGLGACGLGNNEEVTTQSVAPPPAQQVAKVEPDCATLKAEIEKMNGQQIPSKFQQAAAKKYSPTQEEWSLFPRYNNLVDTYTVKKCLPALPVQAEQKKAPVKTQKTAAVKPVQKPAVETMTEKKTDPAIQGVTVSVPPTPPKQATN